MSKEIPKAIVVYHSGESKDSYSLVAQPTYAKDVKKTWPLEINAITQISEEAAKIMSKIFGIPFAAVGFSDKDERRSVISAATERNYGERIMAPKDILPPLNNASMRIF